ncbi:DUF2147 domain-containing protein [Bradyrhizobium sp. SYSU BS000235]|uniref:DUF2147 domain-containing protein n=1 Tax=Bradyrhizobium sp. SYSU BS000235 TaxID=3411332 RepID=UPI003C744EF5
MRKTALSGIILLAAVTTANAAEPLGEWRDEDGKATIKIVDCNSRLWGVVASESIPGGTDSKNPDKAKRGRPTLGMPVLLNLKKASDEKQKWEGKVYNAENGKTYDATIQLKSANALRVEGCLVWPLCGGQTWTRVEPGMSGFSYGPAAESGAAGAPKQAPRTTATAPAASSKTTATAVPPGAPKGAAPKGAASTSKAGATAEAATSEVCLLPEIAGAPH